MSRLERFREARKYRRKIFSSIFLFFLVLITGLCIVDYTTNSLLKDENRIKIFSVQSGDSYIEIAFMNNKLRLDTTYIEKDRKKIREFLFRY